MDLLNEAAQLSKYQIFSPGTGGENFKFDPNKVPTGKLRVGMQMACQNKPKGGFWTSSYKQKFKGSHWTDYKKKKFPSWHSSMGAVFELTGSPKILKIRNHNDYMKIQKKAYKYNVDCPSGELYLDWRAVSKKYDGVQLAGSVMGIPMLGQWDVESTAWFNMRKLKFVGTTKV